MSEFRRLVSTVLVGLVAVPSWAAPQATTPPQVTPTTPLSHQPADCMVSEAHPLIQATAPAGADVASARVYYRSSLTGEFTAIEMSRLGDQWQACLPAPAAQAGTVTYFIAVSGPGGEQRTGEFTSAVVATAGQCGTRMIAPVGTCATVAAPPPGFVAPAPPVYGTSAGGGGLLSSKAFLIAGGAALVGIVTIIAVNDEEPKSGSR